MRGRTAGLLLAAALVASACGSSTQTPAASGAASPALSTAVPSASLPAVNVVDTGYSALVAAKTAGKLVIGTFRRPTMVNPYEALAPEDYEFAASLFEGLVKVTSDLRYIPVMAVSVPTIENGGVVLAGQGMDVTYQLRTDMAWSDGQPISCDDVRMTWEWVVDPNHTTVTAGTAGWGEITGVDGGGGLSCTVHFKTVYEGYLGLFSAILPGHQIQIVKFKDSNAKLYSMADLVNGVYSGPYIPSAVTSTGITLKPNAAWAAIGGHDPWLVWVKWRYYADAAALTKGYLAGDVSLAVGLSEADIPTLNAVPGGQVVARDSLTYELQAFNNTSFRKKFGADAPAIIGAIKLATDREAIVGGPLAGNVSVTDDFVSSLSWFYRDPGTVAAADPTSAATILANAGWARNSEGWLSKGRVTLAVTYCSTTRQSRVDTLALVSTQLKALGIKVSVTTRPNSDVFSTWDGSTDATPCSLVRGNWDVAEFSYVSPIDPLTGYNAYVSTQTPDKGGHTGQNITGISIDAIDKAYGQVKATASMNTVRDAMFTVQQIYGSDKNTYELPLYFRKDVWLVKPILQNFAGGPTVSGAEWNIGDWWLNV
jgi:peptide/nickel transport system substrate-binding protein